jgi:hypothetical protein
VTLRRAQDRLCNPEALAAFVRHEVATSRYGRSPVNEQRETKASSETFLPSFVCRRTSLYFVPDPL